MVITRSAEMSVPQERCDMLEHRLKHILSNLWSIQQTHAENRAVREEDGEDPSKYSMDAVMLKPDWFHRKREMNLHNCLTILLHTAVSFIGQRVRDYKAFLYFCIKKPLPCTTDYPNTKENTLLPMQMLYLDAHIHLQLRHQYWGYDCARRFICWSQD